MSALAAGEVRGRTSRQVYRAGLSLFAMIAVVVGLLSLNRSKELCL